VLIELKYVFPSKYTSPFTNTSVASNNKLVVLIVTVSPLGILVIVLIDSVNVLRLITDDKLLIMDEMSTLIELIADCFARFVGGEYGEIKNGLLLLAKNRLAFDILKSALFLYFLESVTNSGFKLIITIIYIFLYMLK
jgi:hypothetical protein